MFLGMEYRTPAQLLESHLQERGWTQRVLALILQMDENTVSKIFTGKKIIDGPLALRLHDVLGVDPEHLLQLAKSYELAKAKIEAIPDPKIPTRITLFAELPVTDMVKRGWFPGVTDTKNVPKLETALCEFFGVNSVDEIEILPHAAKKTAVAMPATPAQLAWLYRVRQLATDLPAPRYSRDSLGVALLKMRSLLVSEDGVRKVPRILMDCGVRFVIVESLPSAKIDGVCFWLNEQSPVIGMSLRFDRIDNFWFVLRHEIEHVLQEHGKAKAAAMLDTELEKSQSGDIPEEERVANDAASEFCVPKSRLENFIARKAPSFTERDIRGFAATLKVHPGIIAGQLQHHMNRYDLYRNHLVKIRSMVTPNAYVDGWGDVASVELQGAVQNNG